MKRVLMIALFQLGKCLWYLEDYEQAESLFNQIAIDAEENYAGIAAHAKFNVGLMLAQIDRYDDALESLSDARERYVDLGDLPSAQDAEDNIARVESMRDSS